MKSTQKTLVNWLIKARILALAVLMLSLTVTSCDNDDDDDGNRPTQSIVAIAQGNSNLTSLVAALTKFPDLVTTLSGNGTFTVFAPTNAAFEALPAGTVDTLLKPENKDQLTGILTYHVVAGNVMAADLSDGQVVETVNGQKLTVSIKDGTVMINGANVTASDLEGTNGVVHVVDSVLMPS